MRHLNHGPDKMLGKLRWSWLFRCNEQRMSVSKLESRRTVPNTRHGLWSWMKPHNVYVYGLLILSVTRNWVVSEQDNVIGGRQPSLKSCLIARYKIHMKNADIMTSFGTIWGCMPNPQVMKVHITALDNIWFQTVLTVKDDKFMRQQLITAEQSILLSLWLQKSLTNTQNSWKIPPLGRFPHSRVK